MIICKLYNKVFQYLYKQAPIEGGKQYCPMCGNYADEPHFDDKHYELRINEVD